MNQERIKERKGTYNGHEHNHAGKRSLRQRIEAAQSQFLEWRNATSEAHITGHSPDPLPPFPKNPYLPEGEGTEIELFVDPKLSKI